MHLEKFLVSKATLSSYPTKAFVSRALFGCASWASKKYLRVKALRTDRFQLTGSEVLHVSQACLDLHSTHRHFPRNRRENGQLGMVGMCNVRARPAMTETFELEESG